MTMVGLSPASSRSSPDTTHQCRMRLTTSNMKITEKDSSRIGWFRINIVERGAERTSVESWYLPSHKDAPESAHETITRRSKANLSVQTVPLVAIMEIQPRRIECCEFSTLTSRRTSRELRFRAKLLHNLIYRIS